MGIDRYEVSCRRRGPVTGSRYQDRSEAAFVTLAVAASCCAGSRDWSGKRGPKLRSRELHCKGPKRGPRPAASCDSGASNSSGSCSVLLLQQQQQQQQLQRPGPLNRYRGQSGTGFVTLIRCQERSGTGAVAGAGSATLQGRSRGMPGSVKRTFRSRKRSCCKAVLEQFWGSFGAV